MSFSIFVSDSKSTIHAEAGCYASHTWLI